MNIIDHGPAPRGGPERATWAGMIARCANTTAPWAKRYHGRGIVVCERWANSFDAFWADMGPRPSAKHSIDRFPNNAGNYEPGNCRWATRPQQIANSRSVAALDSESLIDPDGLRARILAAVIGRRFRMAEAAADLGIGYPRLAKLVTRLGMARTIDDARTAAGLRSHPRTPHSSPARRRETL